MMYRRSAFLIGALCVGALTFPSPVWAHPHLRSSSPASGSVLTSPPSRVKLVFSEPVEIGLTSMTLVGTGGDTTVVSGFHSVPGEPLAIEANLKTALPSGKYLALWSCMGTDGHGIRGRYSFTVVPVASSAVIGPAAPKRVEADTPLVNSSRSEEVEANSGGLMGTISRTGTFIGILLLLGTIAFWLLVLPRSGLKADAREESARTSLHLALSGAAAILIFTILRVLLESRMMASMPGMTMTPTQVLTGTKWGSAMLVLLAASATATSALLIGKRSTAGRAVAALAGVVAAVAVALGGHAGSVDRMWMAAVTADSIHIVAVSCWIGSLFALTATAIPSAFRSKESDRWQNLAGLVRAFSVVAMASMAVIVVTGTFSAWIQVRSFANLFGTTYGKVLLLKLALFGITAGLGAYNYRSVAPRLGSETGTLRLQRSARSEIGVAVLILCVTGFLTGLSVM